MAEPSKTMEELADRYHEVMSFRSEALLKYHANVLSMLTGPEARLAWPAIGLTDAGETIKRLGPFHFMDRAPIARSVERVLSHATHPLTILEIGPGNGALARSLRRQYPSRIAKYYAIDRDRSVRGPFELLENFDDVPTGIDLVIAAEVIEHLPVDDFYRGMLEPLWPKLSPAAAFAISTPNPLSPGGIARDFTHVQRYPWYDLYAVFRLIFEEVEVTRVHYIFSFRRALQIVPRFLLCLFLELEWCDTLVCVGSKPRAREGSG